MTAPKMTVAMPLYRMSEIVWLALEGLRRQVGAPPWELLVCEEQGDPLTFGASKLDLWRDLLGESDCGCVSVRYLPLDSWVPLFEKWRIMGREAASTSEVFVLHNADDYSPAHRLRMSALWVVGKHHDWVEAKGCYFYHVRTGQVLKFEPKPPHSSLFMATRTADMRSLPDGDFARREESTMFQHIAKNPVQLTSLSDGGFYTHGVNNISSYRNFNNPRPPFSKVSEVERRAFIDTIHPAVFDNLLEMRR